MPCGRRNIPFLDMYAKCWIDGIAPQAFGAAPV